MLTILRTLSARIRAIFRHGAADRDFNEELEAHVAMLAADKMRGGMSAKQARRQARLEVGGITQLQDAHRDMRGLPISRRSCVICDMRCEPCGATPR